MRVPDISRKFNTSIMDWLAFTVPVDDYHDQIAAVKYWSDILGDAKERDGAFYGYDSAVQVAGYGQVMWHSERLDMGVHVQLPSKALSRLKYTPIDLISIVETDKGKVSRIDFAIDTDEINLEDIWSRMIDGELVSKARRGMRIKGFDASTMEDLDGQTIYIGSSGSRRRVRIYDKAAEQQESGTWTRIEVQFRKEHAVTAARHILQGNNPTDLIVSSIDFRTVTADSNISRRNRSSWWSSIVDQASNTISFAIAQSEKTILRLQDWLNRQVSPTLATLDLAFNDCDRQWLNDILNSGQSRMSQYNHRVALEFRGAI